MLAEMRKDFRMDKHIIICVHVTNRLQEVVEVQKLFSKYGGNIKTRLGLHEVEKVDSTEGILILEMHGEETVCLELADRLNEIEGVETQKIIFDHV